MADPSDHRIQSRKFHVTVTKHCSGVVPDCHGVTQNGSGSSSVTSPALVLVETPNESVCGGTVVSTKMKASSLSSPPTTPTQVTKQPPLFPLEGNHSNPEQPDERTRSLPSPLDTGQRFSLSSSKPPLTPISAPISTSRRDPHRTTTEQVLRGWWIILSTAGTLTWWWCVSVCGAGVSGSDTAVLLDT
ncbi:hypothetical protein NFI96_004779 [Prochilodus magdalenae]|nr:hypothetical protein NFI96_004779 [Prochilodus magdalenae]